MSPAGFCRGCARTLEEIAAWSSLPDSGRLAVLERLAARKAQAPRDF